MMKVAYKSHTDNVGVNSDGTKVQQWVDSKGFHHLRCNCQTFVKKRWCTHFEEMLKYDGDGAYLKPTMAVPIYKSPYLIVPMMIMTPVPSFVQQVDHFMSASIVWGDIKMSSGHIDVKGECHVGMIRDGDGRATLRRMAMEWMVSIPQLFPNLMRCQAATHTPGDSPFDIGKGEDFYGMFNAKGEIVKAVLVDAYDILDTTRCRACNVTLDGSLV